MDYWAQGKWCIVCFGRLLYHIESKVLEESLPTSLRLNIAPKGTWIPPKGSVWYHYFGLIVQDIASTKHKTIMLLYTSRHLRLFLKSHKSVGELFPHPVGVFRSLLYRASQVPYKAKTTSSVFYIYVHIKSRSTTAVDCMLK